MKKLSKSREERAKFVDSQISQQIAAQIRALRLRDHLSQPQLAEKIDTSQNQIYRLEKPRTAKPKMSTLKRLANVFDVALVIRFVPFSQFAAWLSKEPYVDTGLSTAALYVPSFEQESQVAEPKEKSTAIRSDAPEEIDIQVPQRLSNEVADIGEFRKTMAGNEKQEPMSPPKSDSPAQQLAAAGGA